LGGLSAQRSTSPVRHIHLFDGARNRTEKARNKALERQTMLATQPELACEAINRIPKRRRRNKAPHTSIYLCAWRCRTRQTNMTTNKTAMILAINSQRPWHGLCRLRAQDDDESNGFIIPGSTDGVNPVFTMITSAARAITPASRG
jgi:hypothetical protein